MLGFNLPKVNLCKTYTETFFSPSTPQSLTHLPLLHPGIQRVRSKRVITVGTEPSQALSIRNGWSCYDCCSNRTLYRLENNMEADDFRHVILSRQYCQVNRDKTPASTNNSHLRPCIICSPHPAKMRKISEGISRACLRSLIHFSCKLALIIILIKIFKLGNHSL